MNLNKVKSAENKAKASKGDKGIGDQFKSGSTLDLDLNSSGRKVTTSDGKIAFGGKAPPRLPSDTTRKSARQV